MVGYTAVAVRETMAPRDATGAIGRAETVAFAGVVLLAFAAPFELINPVLVLPGQSISNLEACVLVATASWMAALIVLRTPPTWRTPLTWPWLASIAAMAAASLSSPVSRTNALHMTGRVAVALGIYLLAVNGLRRRSRVTAVMTALVAAGAAAAFLVLLEYMRIGAAVDWLRAFRQEFTWVGAQLRASGPFQYPSIASMYLEVVFACGLGLWTTDRDTPWLFGALLLVGDAIILTYTRSGLITAALSIAVVGALRYRQSGLDGGTTLVASLAMAIGLLALTSRPAQSLWLRFTTEGQESWYRMSVEAPPEITFAPDGILTIPVTVTNLGRVTWDSRIDPPFSFSSHWYDADGARVVAFYGIRNVFPSPVKPGETIALDARVRAPRAPGRYQLVWDIEYKGRLWFSTEQGAATNASQAIVTGVAASESAPRASAPRPAARPGRLVLWRAAVLMLASRPLLGVGPDDFRLSYGDYASLPSADPRVHSNNMYLELAAGAGLVGCIAFIWLFWRIARALVQLIGAPIGRASAAGFGVAAAIAAIAVHGLVDSFLEFTPTYVLFAIVLGCASALTAGGNGAQVRAREGAERGAGAPASDRAGVWGEAPFR